MSVGGPQLPQGQQGIGQNSPVQSPGSESGNVKTNKSQTKKIGHFLAKLVPNKAKKLFSGHRSVQALVPGSVETTPGLKGSPVKLLSVKPLSERSAQALDVQPKLGDDSLSLQQRRGSVASADSGIEEGDNWSVASDDSYASVRSGSSDEGYSSVKHDQAEFIDDEKGYMTADEVKKSTPLPESDLEEESHYDYADNLKFDDAPDTPEVNEETRETVESSAGDESSIGETNPEHSNSGEESEQDSSGEGQSLQSSVPDEPTISSKEVLARKVAAYEQILDDDDFGALDAKLTNTNDYQTVRNVAQMALQKQGKDSLVFMIAQNRMQELKADQIFNKLGGYQVGADYSQIRKDAAEMMDQDRYSKGYQERVLELVDQRVQEYETRFEGMTPFGHLDEFDDEPPVVPTKSEELMEELTAQASPETKVEDEPPPLPPRPETPTKSKKKRRGIPNFLRRGR